MLGLLTAGLLLNPDEHFIGGAEFLDLHIAQAQSTHLIAQLTDIGRSLRLDLNERAAPEVDTQVQAHREEQNDGPNERCNGDVNRNAGKAQKRDLSIGWNQFEKFHFDIEPLDRQLFGPRPFYPEGNE